MAKYYINYHTGGVISNFPEPSPRRKPQPMTMQHTRKRLSPFTTPKPAKRFPAATGTDPLTTPTPPRKMNRFASGIMDTIAIGSSGKRNPRMPDGFRGSSLPCPLWRGFSLFPCGGSGGLVRRFVFWYVIFMGARFSSFLRPLVARGGMSTPFPLVRCARGGAVSLFPCVSGQVMPRRFSPLLGPLWA